MQAGGYSFVVAGDRVVQVAGAGASGGPVPTVIFLHGAGHSAPESVQATGLQQAALARGWAAAFPQCLGSRRFWRPDDGADLAYLEALVEGLVARGIAASGRLYVAGYSNGATMAAVLAARCSDVAAIASVAGVHQAGDPLPDRGVPAIAIWGDQDSVAGDRRAEGGNVIGPLAWVTRWAGACGIDAAPEETAEPWGRRRAWHGAAPVLAIEIAGLGHEWPGSMRHRAAADPAAPHLSVDAGVTILDFFAGLAPQPRRGIAVHSAPRVPAPSPAVEVVASPAQDLSPVARPARRPQPQCIKRDSSLIRRALPLAGLVAMVGLSIWLVVAFGPSSPAPRPSAHASGAVDKGALTVNLPLPLSLAALGGFLFPLVLMPMLGATTWATRRCGERCRALTPSRLAAVSGPVVMTAGVLLNLGMAVVLLLAMTNRTISVTILVILALGHFSAAATLADDPHVRAWADLARRQRLLTLALPPFGFAWKLLSRASPVQ